MRKDRSSGGIDWRLPALCRLTRFEQQLADFEPAGAEKLDAMKELAYGASHEINNPLANIAARAKRCSMTSGPAAAAEADRDPSPGDAGPRDDLGLDALCSPAEIGFGDMRFAER